MGSAETLGDGHRQRRLARAAGAGQAEHGRRPRAHDQRWRRVRLRFQDPACDFDSERAAGLRARRQRVEDAGLHFLEAAVRAVQRLLQSCPGEPLRLAPPPRQRQDHLGPIQHVLDRVRLGLERLPQRTLQLLADRVGKPGALQGPEHPVDARAGGDQRTHGLQRRTAGPTVVLRRRLGDRVRQRTVGSLGHCSLVPEQSERLPLVHHSRPAGCSQIGQTPPVTLRGGGDHVAGAVPRPPFRPPCFRTTVRRGGGGALDGVYRFPAARARPAGPRQRRRAGRRARHAETACGGAYHLGKRR